MSDQHDDAAVWLAYAFRAGDAVAVGPAYLPPLLPFSPAQSRGFRADLGDTVNFQHDGAWAARFEANTSVSAPFEYARPAASALCGTSPEGFGPFAPLDVREDFTPCFEGTVLAAIPRTILLLYVALVGLAKVFSRSRNASERSNIVRTRDSWLWWAKMIGTSALLLTWLAVGCYAYGFASRLPYPYEVVDAVGGALATVMALVISHNDHKSQIRTSTSMIFFHLATTLVVAIQLRTFLLVEWFPLDSKNRDIVKLILSAAILFLSLLNFALENVAKTRLVYVRLSDSEEDSPLLDGPEEVASIWSRLFFSWLNPLMSAGHAKGFLEPQDLPLLNHSEQARTLSKQFGDIWDNELGRKGKDASLVQACLRLIGVYFLSAAPLKLLQDSLGFVQPTLLRLLIEFARSHNDGGNDRGGKGTQPKPQPLSIGYLIAAVMLGTAVLQSCALHQYFQICYMTGLRLRGAIVTQVYRKALRLSSSARQNATVGEMVNLLAVDAQRIMDLFSYLHILWSGPFQIIMSLYLLYGTLGYPAFAGVAIMIFAIPLNAYLARKSRELQKTQMGNRDSRIKMMDELLGGIKIIKLYAWESRFVERISDIRSQEMDTLRRYAVLSAIQSFFFSATPFLVAFSTFALHALVYPQIPLTSTKVFVSLALFNLLNFPLVMFPSVLSSAVEASVAFSRLRKFLVNEELDPEAVIIEPYPRENLGPDPNQNTPLVEIVSGSFKWGSGSPVLDEINIRCPDRSLVAIAGPVGSGKSSMLSAILGDMTRTEGSVFVRGTVAYAAQSPWIMNSTLRDNVLFGHQFDQAKYDKVLDACGLRSDIQILPGGDMVEIGERGINLSGGQKARVGLARAVYADADIYLLDDTLSAVDSHVARHIFDNVIGPRGLLKDKARIFVTHAISFLPEVDSIYLILDGRIRESGPYHSLIAAKGELHRLITEFGFGANEDEEAEPDALDGIDIEDESGEIPETHADLVGTGSVSAVNPSSSVETPLADGNLSSAATPRRRSRATSLSAHGKEGQPHQVDNQKSNGAANAKGNGELMTKEESARGAVDLSVYSTYAEACGIGAVVIYLVILAVSQATSVMQTFWLAGWSRDNDLEQSAPAGGWTVGWRIGIYGTLGVLYCVTAFIQTVLGWVLCGIRAARTLHNGMLQSVVRLPQSWFDTTSMGRVLNRFSRDMLTVDETIPRSFMSFFSTVGRVAAVLVVDTIATPLFLLFVLPLSYLYYSVSKYYLVTSRELKRLDSVSRSPIFAHFQETLGGVSTIRAFRAENRFVVENEIRVDVNGRAYAPSIVSNRWLAMRLEMLGSLIIYASAMFAVVEIATTGRINASVVGLSLSYALSITQSLNWMVRQSCEIETNIVSVERVKEYIELPQEAPAILSTNRPPSNWPERGHIVFNGFSTRYRPNLDLVLRQISLEIKPGEKVGLCGRTGSGKSSLALSLFRVMEPAEGSISIDGVDVAKIGLYDLRSRLTVIPQDPVLFQGTIRSNVDPFSEHDDSSIWMALESAYLKDLVMNLDGKLDAKVQQGGENFSVGQRQLLSLCRALLRSSKILILDEASSSVDVETDAQIQRAIRREFSKSTILTIAHRINTIIDFDRICVLSEGRVLEFDSPANLLRDKSSAFYALAKEGGWTEGK